ncbi:hypothetical protein CDD81_6418 [Ophiocordyceps australis]|uniref:FAD dependent oxidoreductase domain-containing protein n=1 Tax=Ophiocordyceps australis TaxID=1399860 RepID=A0A2C5Y5U0_9HYPO|nr:hypothetical protein CDD81_6418 [Ophiocordyceps australis]
MAPVFAIIGGGIAGTVQAIHLATRFPWLKIQIYEQRSQILSSTSSINPGRPSFGFHYPDLATAVSCQDNTVKFTKFLESIGCRHIFANAPQHGIYVLVKRPVSILGETVAPVFGPEKLESVYEQIRRHAIRTYADDDIFARHFGPPEDICKRLQRHEYEHLLTPQLVDSVGACYETRERTFNVASICAFLSSYVRGLHNIDVITDAHVTHLEKGNQGPAPSFRITWRNSLGREACYSADLLTLACWEHNGIARAQLGVSAAVPTYNRVKVLAIVDVAVTAKSIKITRPIFIASGPFGMMSPQGYHRTTNGRFMCRVACTLAIHTNLLTVADDEPMPLKLQDLLRGSAGAAERHKLAWPIVQGAKQLFSSLESAELVDVRCGVVRIPFGQKKGIIDLSDPESEHHSRTESGCRQIGQGLFINEAMKLIYSVFNAEKILAWTLAELKASSWSTAGNSC